MTVEQAWATFIVMLVAQVPILFAAIVAYINSKKAVITAKETARKADESHEITSEIKELATRTEAQTNNRLSVLDAKVLEHERKCNENLLVIAELKLALAEALSHKQDKVK